jgi:hypothetical protein
MGDALPSVVRVHASTRSKRMFIPTWKLQSTAYIYHLVHSSYAVTATRRAMSVDLTVGASGTGQQPSDEEVIAFAQDAIEASREESRRGRDGVLSTDLQQPGVTVDLGHRNIVRLPDEVIDIIKQEIERCVNFLLPNPHVPSQLFLGTQRFG